MSEVLRTKENPKKCQCMKCSSYTFAFFYRTIFYLLILVNQISAGGIETREIGTRASSMGGAFRALADDGTAVFWNPAGLVQNKAPSLLAEASFIQMKARVGQSFYNAGLIPGYKTEDVEQKKRQALVPAIAYVQDLKHKLKFGLGMYIQHRFGTEFDVFYDPLNYPSYPVDDMKNAGNFISIHPALAKELNDRISLGFGFFATKGNMEQRNIFISPVSSLDPSSGYFPTDSFLEGDGWGYGGNAGLLYKAGKELTFGLVYRSGTRIKLSGNREINAYKSSGIISQASSFSTNIDLPANIGLGIAYRPSRVTVFTADIDQTRWSSFDRFVIKNDDAPAGELVQPSQLVYDWENTIRYSLGLDYKIDKNYNIYMGYYIDPSPVPDNTMSPLVPDNGNKKSLTLGARYGTNMTGLILGYEYLTGKKRTVTGSPQDVNEDGISDNLPGNYTLISNVFKIGLEILF